MKYKNLGHEEKRSTGIFLGGIGLFLIGISAVLYSVSFCINSTITTRRFMHTTWERTDDSVISCNDHENYDQESNIHEVIDFLSDASTNNTTLKTEQESALYR